MCVHSIVFSLPSEKTSHHSRAADYPKSLKNSPANAFASCLGVITILIYTHSKERQKVVKTSSENSLDGKQEGKFFRKSDKENKKKKCMGKPLKKRLRTESEEWKVQVMKMKSAINNYVENSLSSRNTWFAW